MSNGIKEAARPVMSGPSSPTADEESLALDAWNATSRDYPLDQCVHALFERQASRTPEATALVFGEARLSYGELNARANQLAHLLRARGVDRDSLVALALERGIGMMVALLGVLKAGGAYVPMAPDAPSERLTFMLSDARPRLLLTHGATSIEPASIEPASIDAATTGVPALSLEALAPELAAQPRHNLDSAGFVSSQPAYVIYTSGTTGTPKGVLVSHRNLVNFCYWCAEACVLGAGDRVTQFAPYTFDASAGEMFGSLLAGAELHLLDDATIQDPAALQRYLARHAIQFSAFPPAYLQQMDPDAAPAGFKLLTAGSAPTPELVKRWAGRGHYLNGYGPTETTILSTSTWLSADAETITIGRPIANTQVYLLDAHRQPVPIGAVGEIHIGGAGVALGYLNRPELTAERFLDDPFNPEADARMYRTGDLGRWLPDGTIEFLGRNDFQVKIRGFRIELGEIESRLSTCAGVREAVVTARSEGAGEPQLVAYCLSDDALEATALREALSKHLPEYMLPAAFVRMSAWPLTVNGKLDRNALPAPDDAAYARRAYMAPEGEVEEALAAIWSKLLKLDRVGRDDNFFELGGHSLLAIGVVEAMRRQGWHTDIATLLTAPTLSMLAPQVGRESREVEVPANRITAETRRITPDLLPLLSLGQEEIDAIVAATEGGVGNIQDIYPLSPLQEGMLFHYTLEEHGDIYLLASLLSFADRARLEAFLSAMQQVVDRHDVLRTGIAWEALGMPVQVVRRQVALAVDEVVLDPSEGGIAQQLEARYDPRRCRVDLRHPPLMRLYVAWDGIEGRWLVRMLAHHIVMDHMGYELMLEEVRAIERGQGEALPPSMPYRNFVAQARLGAEEGSHEAFFREMLSEVTEPTAPFGVLAVHGSEGTVCTAKRMLAPGRSEAIRRHSRRLGISPGSVMHLGWALVLARTTGLERVVFGTVLFGRMQGGAHADRALGLFINSLPLRIDIDGERVEAGLKRTHAALARLMGHEHAPLALAQRCSGVEGQAPLFTTLMNYRYSERHGPYGAESGIGLVSESERTNYAVDVSIDDFGAEGGFGLVVSAQHGIDAERLCDYLEGALSGVVEALEGGGWTTLRGIDVMPASEWTRIVRQWNDTARDYPRDQCVHGLFERQAARTPEATALVFGEVRLSYGELNARANRLAHHLMALGVKPDDRVAICVERSVEMVVGLLGILKAGGAYVPLDPAYPLERLNYMLSDSAPVALLTQDALHDRLSALSTTSVAVVALDDDSAVPETMHDPVVAGLTSRHLAYVIYTSGSTGQPKGVAIEHVNTVNLIAWAQANFAAEALGRTLFSTSINFDLAVFELFVPLSSGATVVLARDILAAEPATEVSLINTVPSAITALIDADQVPRSARIVNLAGEPLKRALTERIFASTQADAVANLYGPTETTTYSTWVRMDRAQGFLAHIGRPIANTQVFILDMQRRPVPQGVIGELYIGGDGVARGYLNRPELTAERFLDDPFNPEAGARMYRTGDLGRWLPDGNIEYLGRNDFQVKIRGFRIELGEIEARLSTCGGVREAVVVAREDTPGDRRLVAYVTLTAGEEPAIAVWRAELGSQLQEYMVPSAFVVLAAMPLTPNGKLDRKSLPAPDGDAYASRAYEAPEGEVERMLAEIWMELLKLDRVGRHDNFFELGGHSLIAVTMISRIQKLGLHADVRSLFSAPELMAFAAGLQGDQHRVPVPANLIPEGAERITPEMLTLVSLNPSEIDAVVVQIEGGASNIQDIYPLSPLQEGILFHRLLDQSDDIYLLLGMLSFRDRDRIEGFLSALQQVIDRHDVMRTIFVWNNLKDPLQIVLRNAFLSHEELVLDPAQGPVKSQLEARYSASRFRMDLARAPLMQCAYAQDAESGLWLMCAAFHHLVMDHSTLEIIKEEAWLIQQGRARELPKPTPYRNYIWRAKVNVDLSAHDAYFTRMLKGIEQTTAPFGLTSANDYVGHFDEARRDLPEAVSAQIRRVARELGVSAAAIVHFAWGLVLRRATGMDSVVFGTLLFGRMDGGADADRTLGVFINTLPVRLDMLAGGIAESIRATHAVLAELMRHEHASLALAQRCSAVPASMPLFTSLLNYRHSTDPTAFADDIAIVDVEGGERTNYPLAVAIDDLGEAFGISVQTLPSVGAERVCDFMQAALAGIIEALKKGHEAPVSDIDVLPPHEKRLVVREWNDTAQAYPLDACVHRLFERQASRTPEATALVFGEARLSYGELNARANQLAHLLRARGVDRDTLVAVALERGIGMMVALLGVLKAGGAYVPMAPDAPSERLTFMLSDACPRLLLTHGATSIEPASIDAATTGVPALSLEALASELAAQPRHNPDSAGFVSSQPAYVIYTSGTTGTPKGVLVSHRNLVNFCYWCAEACVLGAGDRVTQFAPYTFDASAGEMFGSLLAGAELHLLDDATIQDPAALQRYLARHAIQFSAFPPAYLQQMDPDAAPAGFKLLTAGSAPTPELVKRWAGRGHYLNGYGPTETTILSTSTWLSADAETITIGRPIANTQVYLLDAHREPVPIGAVGEIHIGGAGVALGYLNRPELTAERFLDDPFNPEAGARMYRTGDLGRWLPDGTIEFLGRNDFQVKIRGFRIELGEIESALADCDGIREAVVLARDEAPGEKQLVAYYLSDQRLAAASLREQLTDRLPDYMVPAAFVPLSAWPLTVNGKLDRKALPAPDDAAYVRRAYMAPEGEVEEALAATWSELLGIERVGREDNFFELGGHSLLAVQLMSRLHGAFEVEVPLRAVFDSPTLSQLAARIAQADASQLSTIAVVERQPYLPLSLAQQRLWVLTQIDGASAAYHMGGALTLEGDLDRPALARAFQRIVDRHEALRTQFVQVDGQPMQAIVAGARIEPAYHDLRGRSDRDAVCRSMGDAFMARPFDLRHDLPLRVQLIWLEDRVHQLQVVMHHIVSDGWSIGIMLSELSRLYAADIRGEADPLPPLAIQYVDYAQWQRQWLADGQLARQVGFWQRNLAGAPTLLELPTDRRRPAQQDFAGAIVDVRLDAALTAALKALSQRHGVTLYMTLLASWAAVLGRLSNQEEVVIGSPVAGRNRAEIEPLIGFFVNTLAFRIDLGGEPSVGELLLRVKQQVLDAQAHQDLPFDQMVEAAKPPRSMAHTPIFQTMLAWQNQAEARLEMPGLSLSTAQTEVTTAKFDLTLNLQELEGAIVGGVAYATALFERATTERYVRYWVCLLEGMASEPALPVARLPMLDAAERTCVLETWNQTAIAYPDDALVHTLFEAQVARTPDAIALSFEGRELSYAELNRRANRLAHQLQALGVRPGDRVGICIERGIGMVVAVLASLKSGGAYVPLDPAFPHERLGQIIEDSRPLAALVDAQGRTVLASSAGALLAEIVQVDVAQATMERDVGSEGNPGGWRSIPAATHPAYVLFTSGSTGRPKGVCVPHRAAANFLLSMAEAPGLRAEDTLCAVTTLSFDIALLELLLPLTVGARVALADRATAMDADALAALLEAQAATVMQATPATWRMLLDAGWRGRAGMRLLCGGEALPLELAERLLGCGELWNMYGPTETTVWSMIGRIMPGPSRITLGHPIANTQVYLLDAHRQPVPIGAVGEIHIGGAGVALGYLNRPELTAERFLDDPFNPEAGARMYRTGDLGRWLPDGTIEFLGRNDFQVKIRGFRIELGEIESRLSTCAGVREAVVIARIEGAGEPQLVAYCLSDDALEATALRDALSKHLPDYMLPAAFVRMSAWPLTNNGKLDRTALPAPGGDAYASRTYEAPEGEVERTLAALWSELLTVDRVGRHDNFFELGGHSLLAVQLMSRLHGAFEVEVPLRAVFDSPTLSQLAARIAQADASQLSAITVVERQPYLPLSLAQQRLWVLTQIDGASAAYHMGGALMLEGNLDRPALARAFQRIVDRHEALRTQFVQVDGQPMQAIVAGAMIEPAYHDLRGRSDRGAVCRSMGDAFMARPFDLRHDLPLRVQLIRREDRVHQLQVVMHHIVSDGWSIGIMLSELSQLYAAYVEARPDPLPPLAIQYVDYAQWQRQWLADGQLARQVGFWQRNLAGAPALLELPTDRRRPAQQDFAGDVVDVRLDAALTAALKALSQRHGVTLYMTLLASWAAVLGRLSNQEEVVIGSPVAGRNRAEIEPLIGFFVNTLAFRIDLGGEPSVGELLARVKQQVLDAQAHQDLPFDQMVEAAKPPRSMAHTPVFQTMLAWQNQAEARLEMPGLTLSTAQMEVTTAKFDLTLDLFEDDGLLSGALNYAVALFDRTTVERYLGYWVELLRGMLSATGSSVFQVPLLDDAERQRILVEWNDTARDYPQDQCVHALFEAQAARTPDAKALVSGTIEVSYEELNRRANRLAHRLMALGVKPDDRVAICAERSIEMVVGLLGILKAGGAYVPLDPASPVERSNYMLSDSTPVALLTQGALPALMTTSAAVVALDDDSAFPEMIHDPVVEGLTSRHLAYVIYTSGSTGQPKGVMVEHRNVLRLVINNQYAPIGPGDCIAQCANPAFDASTWELWAALLNGARAHLVERQVLLDPQALCRTLIEGDVNALWLTVGLFNDYAIALAPAFERLKYLLVGGDALDPRVIARTLSRTQRPRKLINGYGPTETTTFATTYPIVAVADDLRSIPIGRPIANTRVYLLDQRGRPVPIGAVGEIYIGGDGVARGYLNRPELTAERFLDDPFNPEAGGRMYRTGDLGRWLPDGNIEFLGRNDFQVKIRGFRVELGEIEAALADCDGIREAVVVAREDVPGEKRLVAYCLTDNDLNAGKLRQALSQALPDYMLPAAFVRMDAWPLTNNGKLDRKALPAPDGDACAGRTYEAPEGEIERTLAALWSELLMVDRVGRHDNFFELGGSSIQLIRMLGRLGERGIALSVVDVYRLGSLEAIAAEAACVRAEAERPDPGPATADAEAGIPLEALASTLGEWLERQRARIETAAALEDYAFSAIQRNYLAWSTRDSVAHVTVTGRYTAEALQAAFAALVCEQDLLRSAPDLSAGRWRLLEAAVVNAVPLPAIEVRREAGVAVEAVFAQALEVLVAARMRSPLAYAGAWLSISQTEHHLLLSIDHLIWDGASQEALQRRVNALLRGQVAAIEGSYRQFVAVGECRLDPAITAGDGAGLARAALARTMAATCASLATRAGLPLRAVMLQVPHASGQSPVEQAFEGFRRWSLEITGLARLGLVLNHHGRQRGAQGYYDHIGLFLDKVPFAVDEGTTLQALTDAVGELQRQGLGYVAMESRAVAGGLAPTLPTLVEEVLFNFQSQTISGAVGPSELDMAALGAGKDGYCGLLFEGFASAEQTYGLCLFRGSEEDVQSLVDAFPGSRVIRSELLS